MLHVAVVCADTVRPMLELIWAPLLGAFSLLFDEYSDPRLLAICLAGFEAATCLAAQLRVTQLRDVFVNSLCNFTHVHTPRCEQPSYLWKWGKYGGHSRTFLGVYAKSLQRHTCAERGAC